MDRKAWIVVTLCALGMGLNAWFMSKNQAEQAKIAAEKAKIVAEQKKLEVSKQAAAPTPSVPAAKTAPDATPGAPEVTKTLVSGTVTYEFTTKGGGIKQATLAGRDKVVLNKHGSDPIAAFRREPKTADDTLYEFKDASATSVTLEGTTKDGLVITKTFTTTSGENSDEHLLKMKVTVSNKGTAQLKTDNLYLYAGAAESLRPDDIYKPGVFWNDSGDSDTHETTWFTEKPGTFSAARPEFAGRFDELRFGGVSSRFYLSMISLITEPTEHKPGRMWSERFKLDHANDEFKDMKGADQDYAVHASVGLPPLDLAPAASQSFNYELYLGPKEYHRLGRLGGQRDSVMFYGWAKPVSLIFVNLMRFLHNVVGSWGWAIILMTVLVRLCTWPVFASSIKQGKRMAKLQPLMKEIQEKYKEDQQRQSQEMMKLYKDYGFNPLGCFLPMVIQILIFTGFFGVLKFAAELRGESFGWVADLSLPDTITHVFGLPLNPLPLLMGFSTIIQMKLTPQSASVDKSQQRMMMFMPFIFVYICYNFAAALALYYTTQNVFGIFQSWAMRRMNKDDNAPLQKVAPMPTGPASPNRFGAPGANDKPAKDKKRQPKLGG
jgi:YidC/Oxa1 family membrane protein insertase